MDGYVDGRLLIVKQRQAERRDEAAGNRLALEWRREEAIRGQAARLLATVVVVVLTLAVLASTYAGPEAGALLGAGATPAPGLP